MKGGAYARRNLGRMGRTQAIEPRYRMLLEEHGAKLEGQALPVPGNALPGLDGRPRDAGPKYANRRCGSGYSANRQGPQS